MRYIRKHPILIFGFLIFVCILFKIFGPFKVDNALYFSGLGKNLSGKVINGNPSIDPSVGSYSLALGYRAISYIIDEKIFPLWNHYSGLGQPLLGAMTSAAMFPFTLLLGLNSGQVLMHSLMQFIGGIGFYLFLRALRLSPLSSALGAILFGFNGVLTWQQHAVFNSTIFLPWILYSVQKLYLEISTSGKINFRYVILGSIYSSLALYAGFPEVTYLASIFIALYVIVISYGIKYNKFYKYILSLFLILILGLILSSPLLTSFIDYLPKSYSGGHDGGAFKHVYNPRIGLITYIFPYSFGPIFGIPTEINYLIWGSIGGYIGFFPVLFSIASLFYSQNKRLKVFLLLWIIVSIGVSHGMPFVLELFFEIPLMAMVAVSRYITITWIISLIILCCFYLDDVTNTEYKNNIKILAKAFLILFTLILIYYVFVDKNQLSILLSSKKQILWHFLSLIFCFILLIIYFLLSNKFKKNQNYIIFIILVFETLTYNFLPVFAHHRTGNLDYGLIKFLKDNLGFQRVINMPGDSAVISHNYGSLFGFSLLNYEDVMAPKIVADYIKTNLNKDAHANIFIPDFPPNLNYSEKRQEFIDKLYLYGNMGLKYVLQNKKVSFISPDYKKSAKNHLIKLDNNRLAFNYSMPISGKKLSGISILQGNYGNNSDGYLRIKICSSKFCTSGIENLKNSKDNQYFDIKFDKPILMEGNNFELIIDRISGTNDFALWGGVASNNISESEKFSPIIKLKVANSENIQGLSVAYENEDILVYRLNLFKPYLSANNCSLDIKSRDEVIVDCSEDSQIIRLESYDDSWFATIDGKVVPIQKFNNLFQKVSIAKGKHKVVFCYRPKFFTFSVVFSLVTLLILIFYLVFKNDKTSIKSI